mmetsp:Transcript_17393/g.24160  ORF Transcript_17393/g.24160 Transcript_17393/m.24160 type:complete len:81 (+) Transcript_17393:152-394(+)
MQWITKQKGRLAPCTVQFFSPIWQIKCNHIKIGALYILGQEFSFNSTTRRNHTIVAPAGKIEGNCTNLAFGERCWKWASS